MQGMMRRVRVFQNKFPLMLDAVRKKGGLCLRCNIDGRE